MYDALADTTRYTIAIAYGRTYDIARHDLIRIGETGLDRRGAALTHSQVWMGTLMMMNTLTDPRRPRACPHPANRGALRTDLIWWKIWNPSRRRRSSSCPCMHARMALLWFPSLC
jgi:hypothetical protein